VFPIHEAISCWSVALGVEIGPVVSEETFFQNSLHQTEGRMPSDG